MRTLFGGARHQTRADELPLSAYPAWGLEIMMGLYGPDNIRRACAEDGHVVNVPDRIPDSFADIRPACQPTHPQPEVLSPLQAEIEAAALLADVLGRLFRRRTS